MRPLHAVLALLKMFTHTQTNVLWYIDVLHLPLSLYLCSSLLLFSLLFLVVVSLAQCPAEDVGSVGGWATSVPPAAWPRAGPSAHLQFLWAASFLAGSGAAPFVAVFRVFGSGRAATPRATHILHEYIRLTALKRVLWMQNRLQQPRVILCDGYLWNCLI